MEETTGWYYVLTRIRRANGEFQVSVVDGKLVAAAPDMASMLRELEWAGYGTMLGPSDGVMAACPICRSTNIGLRGAIGEGENGVHTPDCRLSALLAELPK